MIGQQPSNRQRLRFGDEIVVIAFQPPGCIGDKEQERFRIRVHEPDEPRYSEALLTRDELLAHVQECMRVLGPVTPARVDAVWLRTDSSPEIERSQGTSHTPRPKRDPADRDQVLRVLVKLAGIAVEYQVSPTGQLISHITEGHALDRKPIDPVTSVADPDDWRRR